MKTSGLDVHKDSIFCAIYNGKAYGEVKEYSTPTPNIRLMGEYLRGEGVNRVAMESTSTYRVPIGDILLAMGFELTLVNPFLIKTDAGQEERRKRCAVDSIIKDQTGIRAFMRLNKRLYMFQQIL
jgi:transposase